MSNENLNKARQSKSDEFYTQYKDVKEEVENYAPCFKNKIVYCNCDNPKYSNFYKYFIDNFEPLGLKQIMASCYGNHPLKAVNDDITLLNGDGDFRSDECIDLLKQSDIVVTNPPFSLFREYLAQLFKYGKQFLILGNHNALGRNEIFPLIQNNKMWIGINGGEMAFVTPKYYEPHSTRFWIDEKGTHWRSMGNVYWFTNLEHHKRHELFQSECHYNPALHLRYDNYDAININSLKEIPMDYDGVMGVPLTFLKRYNPKQFKILGMVDYRNESGLRTKIYTKEDVPNPATLNGGGTLKINGEYKPLYARILIQRI